MKIMIAIPCMAKIDALFTRCLIGMDFRGLSVQVVFSEGSLIYDGRNQLVTKAIDGGFDRILWVDSDMVMPPDLLRKLNARLDEGVDYVSALAFRRQPPYLPVIYSQIAMVEKNGIQIPSLTPMEDYPENSFFEIAGSGFGCVMTSVDLCRRIRDNYGLPFSPRLGFGEDITFCIMAHELGAKMYCDSSAKVGHIGTQVVTEELYRREKDEIQHNNSGV